MPRELLDQKFALNRARHARDMRTANEYLRANYGTQEAFLKELADINRI